MQNLTPLQLKGIQTWTEQRDNLLREIGVLSTQLDDIVKGNEEKGLASADLDRQIAEKRGRLAELDALETRYRGSLATDIAALEVRKSRLEGECLVLEEKAHGQEQRFSLVYEATGALQSAHDTMKDQAVIVSRVVGEVIQTSQVAASDMKVVMVEIKSIADQVIDKANSNLAQTSIVLEKLPKYVFELQRPLPVRRRYAEGHVHAVREEIKPE